MKSIKDFKKVEITTEKGIYGGRERTGTVDNPRSDRYKRNGDLKTNIDWNPFNNDLISSGGC